MIVGITMHQPPVSAAAHPALDHLHNSSSNNISNAEASEFVPGGGYVEDNTYSTHHYHHHHHYESATTMNAVAASAVPPTMQQHTSSMNDDAVQHPVYVSSSEVQQQHHSGMMVGMEQQFAQFGIQQQDGTDRLASSAHNDSSENNDTEHNEGGEDLEEEPVKLFVGQVSDVNVFYMG